jgi:hypothetical protein
VYLRADGKPVVKQALSPACYHFNVKKLFLILLLAIVPFQFAWAAAGVYCQHENGAASQHFGHHAHQHQGTSDHADGKTKSGKIHLDCSSCHGAGCAISPAEAIAEPVQGSQAYAKLRPISYTSHIPDGPRRPDRFPVA